MIARRKKKLSKTRLVSCSFSENKIEAMKQKARELSKMIAQNSKSINQPLLQPEICTNSESCLKINSPHSPNDMLPQNVIEFEQNTNEFSTVINKDNVSIPSCSDNQTEEASYKKTASLHYVSKRKNNRDSKTKHKKSKIPFLVKCDVYQEESVDEVSSKKQDDYVLEKLFNKSGIFY